MMECWQVMSEELDEELERDDCDVIHDGLGISYFCRRDGASRVMISAGARSLQA